MAGSNVISIAMVRSVISMLALVSLASMEENLSSRNYDYSSKICLKSSTNFSAESVAQFDTSSCYLSCTFSSSLTILTNIDRPEQTKRFIFRLRDVKTDCEDAVADKEEFENTFSVKLYKENKLDKQIKGQSEIIRGLQNGIIDTFLHATDVHEGKVAEDPGCRVLRLDEQNLIGFEKHCNLQNVDKKELVTAKVESKEIFHVIYSDEGRNVARRECVFYSTNLQENIGLVSFTSVDLNLSEVLEVSDGKEENVVGNEIKQEIERGDQEEVINKGKNLMVKIQKTKVVSIEGSKAFLSLVSLLKTISKENAEAFITKFKTKKAFKHLVDAAAGSSNLFVHKTMVKVLSKNKNKNLLERYLIALGFINPSNDLVSELLRDIENIPEKDENVRETGIYSLCHLVGKLEDSENVRKKVFSLVRGSGSDCKSVPCQRRMVNCVAAMGRDCYTKQLLQQVKSSQDKLAREMAVIALGKPGLVPDKLAKNVAEELLNIFKDDQQNTLQRLAAFNSITLDNDTSIKMIDNLGRNNKDLTSFVTQKLYQTLLKKPDLDIKRKILNYDFLSLQNSGQSVYVSKDVANLESTSVGFVFSLIMNGNALKRTNFVLKTEDETSGNEIIRLDSIVGGLSSFVGDADPEDDPEANASVQLSLLGLPLRPFVLFSSFGDLVEMYWSGAAEKLTSFLSGSVLLLDRKQSFPLSNGLELKIQATASISFDFSGKAEISIWTKNGKTHVENAGVIVVNLEAKVGDKFLVFENSFAAEGMLEVDTDINMSGDEVLACVMMKQKDTKLELTELQTLLDKEKETAHTTQLPGVTWNLNMKNNQMCNNMLGK
eukprot:GFUD01039891.1.p1 GENE.GFUD01039891.1~~GFUD01039891.1.p1  ORF type:complete len:830 (-),score=230.17 GFUD01039891.1:47-2536(-)